MLLQVAGVSSSSYHRVILIVSSGEELKQKCEGNEKLLEINGRQRASKRMDG